MTEGIVLGSPTWFWPALIAFVVITSWIAIAYWRSPQRSWPLLVASLLKILGVGMLLSILLDPMLSSRRPQSQSNFFAVLVDNSQSMKIEEVPTEKQVAPKLAATLAPELPWQKRLEQDFQVRRYRFDRQMQAVDQWAELDWSGLSSRLNRSITDLVKRFENRPLAGVLLFSDGNATDLSSQMTDWKKLGAPIYPVLLREDSAVKDLHLERLSISQTDFEASPVTIDAQYSSVGFEGRKAKLILADGENKEVQSADVPLGKDGEVLHHRFQFKPTKSGVQGYQVRLRLSSEASLTNNDTSVETTLLNNQRYAVVDRGIGPYRILYVAGRPNWEFKFLRRALDADEELKLISLIRIAKKEPKFAFRDSKVDSANPLFSGFEDVSEEDKEGYDEPVLVRLGVEASDQLSKGFPKNADEMFEYHAVILDDIEHDFFTQEQLILLRQFVSIRGGGLLALGGQEMLRGKTLRESTLGDLLPVYPDESMVAGANALAEIEGRWELSREGWLQPWLRLTDNETAEKKMLAERTGFQVFNEVEGVKPGASVLVETTDPNGKRAPVMASQKFGKGKTAALMAGDLWRWAMHKQDEPESPLLTSWRQTVRWLIADVPKRIQVQVIRPNSTDLVAGNTSNADVTNPSIATNEIDASGATMLRATILDEQFKPLDNIKVMFQVRSPSGKVTALQGEPSSSVPGAYETSLVSAEEGVFQVEVDAVDATGTSIGKSQAGWTLEPSAEEFQRLELNRKYLEQIAKDTGGEVVRSDALDSFVGGLKNRDAPITENYVVPLWHEPWIALLAITCLCAEWGVRRFYGLA